MELLKIVKKEIFTLKIKKTITAVVVVLCLSVLLTFAASAYGVTVYEFKYKNAQVVGDHYEIGRNLTVKAYGQIKYDTKVCGFIPIYSTCYFYLETPSASLNKPTKLEGSWSGNGSSFVPAYSDICGNNVYRFYTNFTTWLTVTKEATATTTSKSTGTGIYTGGCHTGSGHDSDGSSLGSIKTK